MYPIQVLDVPLIKSQDLSVNITSSSLEVKEVMRLCVQASWSGTNPIGTLHVQGSNDNVTFTDDPEISPISISGNTGNAMVKISNCSYPYLQLAYVATSGTGTLTALVNGKNR